MEITRRWIDLSPQSPGFKGYLAAPAGDEPRPAVVVIQEIFGVNSHIRSIADRLAGQGFLALAPDMFWRVKPGYESGYSPAEAAAGRELLAQTGLETALEDVSQAMRALAAQPQAAGQKLGLIGFCWGGLVGYLAAARLKPDAAVVFYGRRADEFLEEAANIRCPIQFHYGGIDPLIPLETVRRIEQGVMAQDAAGAAGAAPRQFYTYPQAGHGFNCDARAGFHPPSAQQAWGRAVEFLGRHL